MLEDLLSHILLILIPGLLCKIKYLNMVQILTYNDLPEGCEPVTIDLGYPNDNLQSNRYIFKLYEDEYEHFSGSLYHDDCTID